MNTTPKTRADLALLVPAGGLVIELGVAAGKFAAEMLVVNPAMQYIGVDRWSDHHDDSEMRAARERLRTWEHHAHLRRATFAEHVGNAPDAWADMIYIDGYAHTGQEGGQTLRDWWPKLKPGGIFAGHDYSGYYPETINAVDDFVRSVGMSCATNLKIIDELPHPSWWLRKPNTPKP